AAAIAGPRQRRLQARAQGGGGTRVQTAGGARPKGRVQARPAGEFGGLAPVFARGIHDAGQRFDLSEIKLGPRIVEERLQSVACKSHAAPFLAEVVRGGEGFLAAARAT